MKKHYETPIIESEEIKIEEGFAASGGGSLEGIGGENEGDEW